MNDALTAKIVVTTTPYSSKAAISIHLLGQFKLEIGGGDQTHLLTYDKVKLMLAVLGLAQGRSIQRARLADMLWPDSHGDQGLARVRHALHTLRQALAALPTALIVDASGIRLCPEQTWVDVLDVLDDTDHDDPVAKLRNRLEMYAGPLLEDLKLPASDTLMSWHHSWNARLELELTQCRQKLIDTYLDSGDTQTALTYAKWWVDRWPEDETCHRLLIRLLLLAGNREAAMLAFQHCCDVLNKRLGVTPNIETRSLLGLENQALTTKSLVDNHQEQHSYRPIATLAIALSWNTDSPQAGENHDHAAEDALEIMHAWHARLFALAAEYGAWLPLQGSTTILAHFGYPSLSERPITDAARLAKAILLLEAPSNILMGLALHADIALIGHSKELGLSPLFCQHVIPLAWQANHAEVLLSSAAAARMSDWCVQVSGDDNRKRYQLSFTPPLTQAARMHGRLTEFDTLVQQFTRHRQGQKPVVINLYGLPGLGKSQLAQAMADYVRHIDGWVIRLENHENQNDIPLHAFQQWLREQLQLPTTNGAINWSPSTHALALSALQEKFALSVENCESLLNALSIPLAQATQQIYDDAITVVLRALLSGRQAGQPVLVTWDNSQWMDKASKQLLDKLLDTSGLITMVLSTSRNDDGAPCAAQQLTLKPLTKNAIAELVALKTKPFKLSRDTKAAIVSNSAGVPLYAKELVHLASLGQCVDSIPRLTDFLSTHLLSNSSLTRDLAMLLSLLPSLPVLLASQVLEVKKEEILNGLQILQGLGVVYINEQDHYVCNKLTHRSLRLIMVRHSKKTLCAKIAAYLIKHKKNANEVAYHLQLAESAETGIWWQRAVQEALQQGSVQQATEYIAHALASGKYIDQPAKRSQFEFECSVTLGSMTMALQGPVAPEAILAYQRAAQTQIANKPDIAMTVLWNQWVIQHNLGNLTQGLHVAEKLYQMANTNKHEAWYGWALYAMAQHDLWKGNPASSETLLLQSLTAINQSSKAINAVSAFGSHSYSLAYAALGLSQALQGRYSVALQNINHAIQLAQRNHSVPSLLVCQLHLLRVYYLANNMPSLLTVGTEITECLHQHTASNSVWWAMAQAHILQPEIHSAHTPALLGQLQESLFTVQKNMPLVTDGYMCLLARYHIALGKPDSAIRLLDKAAAIGYERQSALLGPEISCLRGDAWLAMHRPDMAKQEWQSAHDRARHHTLLAYSSWATERLATLRV